MSRSVFDAADAADDDDISNDTAVVRRQAAAAARLRVVRVGGARFRVTRGARSDESSGRSVGRSGSR